MVFSHCIDALDIDSATWHKMLDVAITRKKARAGWPKGQVDNDAPLLGQVLALIFTRPSTRTRISFEMAMRQLGGQTLMLSGQEMQLNRGETIADTARVMNGYVDAVMMRTSEHNHLTEWAAHATIPVINGLSNYLHPCQMFADVMTMAELIPHKLLSKQVVAWVGDGDNNVCHSWIQASHLFGFELKIAAPAQLQPSAAVCAQAGQRVTMCTTPQQAVQNADVVVTDTWVSMGCPNPEERQELLQPYKVDAALMVQAADKAIFMHCLPAHRGDEVTDEVMDGAQSAVWQEAENRLHAQKAILLYCLGRL